MFSAIYISTDPPVPGSTLSDGEVCKIDITSPADVFGVGTFTIIGACIERGYVFVGYDEKNAKDLPINMYLPPRLVDMAVLESKIHGPVLIIQTNDHGEPIDIVFDF